MDKNIDLASEALALCDSLIHTDGKTARAAACELRPKIERALLAAPAGALVAKAEPLAHLQGPKEKAAKIAIHLAADSGYTATQDARISAEQWGKICAVIEGTESAAAPAEQTQAARDVLAERRRQVEQEGWTPSHDDQYKRGDLSRAAACYALHTEPVGNVGDYLRFWPWPATWWKPRDKRSNLVKAGALILADIERMDRTTHQPTPTGEKA